MLNRISTVVASATLITVGTLAFSSAARVGGESNLSASNVDYGQEHSSMSLLSDPSNLSLPAIPNLSKPNTYFNYCILNWCW
ncbi:MAG: hypothetical protein AB1589_01790 [Cyanobacteriota bacterium]